MHYAKWVMVSMALCGVVVLLDGCKKPVAENVSLAIQTEGQGSIVLDPPGASHAPGTVVTLTAMATPGTHFDHWAGDFSGSANPATVTVDADLSITAVFAPNRYTLAYAAPFGGGISGTSPQQVLYGGSGTAVTAVTGTGLHFVRWSDGSADNPRTDANVTADISVYAEFAVNTYTLSYTAGEDGRVDGETAQTVNHGANGTAITAVAETGRHFVRWSDGSVQNPRTETNVTADLSVSAEFAVDTFTLSYAAGEHGSITGPTPQEVAYGVDGVEVIAVADAHYHFVQWSDGVNSATRTDRSISGDLSVTAEFAIDTFTLTYTAGEHGSVTGATSQTVDYGTDGTEVTAVPYAHCHFVRWSDGSIQNPRTDTNLTTNISVTAEFAIDTFTLSYAAGEHGSVTAPTLQTVDYGADGVEVTAVAEAHYHFVQWSDGVTSATRTDTNITDSLSVSAQFAIDTFTLSYVAGEHGSVTGPTLQTVDYDADGTAVTAVADAHYRFVQWSDGVNSATRTDSNITGDLNVTAEFAIDTFTLTYTAGEHGGVTGPISQTVDYGADGATVTAAPDTGYHFVQWSDGVTTAARADMGVTANLGVTASFAINVYTLRYTAGANGTLSGATAQTVDYGADGTAVTAVPDTDYHFVQWSDGVAAATRTDTEVTGDITVTAEFEAGIVVHVDADSTATAPDGVSWATAYPELQAGVDAAPFNAQVWVAEGAYTSTANTVLNMRAAVLIYGGFAGTEVRREQRDWNAHKSVIDGENARRCVFGADYAALDGFTVTRGSADLGGGMLNSNASPVIARCFFVGNSAANSGGGMCNNNASPIIAQSDFMSNSVQGNGAGMFNGNESQPTLTDCTFIKNTAQTGYWGNAGGGMCNSNASPSLTHCYFTENSAYDGGGMDTNSGHPTVKGCVFVANTAHYGGGGMKSYNCSTTVVDCILARNYADKGGALHIAQGSPTMTNCVLMENTATEGGGLYDSGDNLTLTNCTFLRNAANNGGALYTYSYFPEVKNCILWDNSATIDGPEIYMENTTYTPRITYSCVEGGVAGTGNINADPLFVDAGGESLYLGPDSPCLDAGTLSGAPTSDLAGRPRPAGSGVDMGAYEGATTTGDLVTLTVQASPGYGGSTLPAAGAHQYLRGERVSLAAVPQGMRFTGWTGDLVDSTRMTSIVMDTDKTVTAEFVSNVVYVNAANTGPQDGQSWATAYSDIQSAVEVAPIDNSGEVWVAEGTYTATTDTVVTLKRGVLLYGGFAGNETSREQRDCSAHASVIDGEGARRGVLGADTALLDGFTITRGSAFSGGGMANDGSAPTVRHCVFIANTAAQYGAGIWNNGTGVAPKITDCAFLENSASYGGAIYNLYAEPQVSHCLFRRNSADLGGGTFEQGGYAQVSDCSFVENTAGEGGGVYSQSFGLTLSRCALVGNSATYGEGGGVFDGGGYGDGVVAENCLFLRNSAMGPGGYGGALRPADAESTKLSNCTFTQNAASSGGALGGDYVGSSYHAQPIITNCILWGNRAIWDSPEIYAGPYEDYYFVTNCCIQGGYLGAGNIDADPLFVDGSGGSVQVREGSPCLDTGTTFGMMGARVPTDDFLGRSRPLGSGMDMGAYEGAAAAEDLVTLTIRVSPAEGGYTQPNAGTHTYVRGETARVTALPLGMRFMGWTGDAAGASQDLELVMDADKTVTAEFAPNIVYVSAAQSGPADGRSWATAFSNIQQGVGTAAADPGGEVWVAEGTYMQGDEWGLNMRPGVSLYGGFVGNETAREQRDWNAHQSEIDGGLYGSGVDGADDAVLDGFAITGSQPGMYIRYCSPRVANCLFFENAGSEGSGISNEGGSPTIVNCTFKQNKQGMFAGGMSSMGGAPTVTDCLFVENVGCGMYNGGASATVTNCTFEKNGGGGMKNEFYLDTAHTVTVSNCVFLQNAVEGGMRNYTSYPVAGHVAVSNSVFLKNAGRDGGGVISNGVSSTFTNCTFTQNTAMGYGTTAGRGGAFFLAGGDVSLTNCILWGNTAADGPEISVGTGALTMAYSCAPPEFGGAGNFYLSPLFVDAANGDLRLRYDSPCVDTGIAVGAPATDLDGTPRPQGAGVDIGAYER